VKASRVLALLEAVKASRVLALLETVKAYSLTAFEVGMYPR